MLKFVTLKLSLSIFDYQIKDSQDATSTAQVVVTVTGVNDAVVIDANNKPTFETNEDTSFTITEAALLANASDIDNDNLSVTNLSIANATIDRRTDDNTGEISFIVTPAENYNGENIKINLKLVSSFVSNVGLLFASMTTASFTPVTVTTTCAVLVASCESLIW
jgi:hypothetical protein